MIAIKLLMFAYLKDLFRVNSVLEISFEKDSWTSAGELKEFLLNELYLKSKGHLDENKVELPSPGTIMLAINEEYVNAQDPLQLKAGDVIALIPPVSGG